MGSKLLGSLKGRDLRALHGFRDRLRAAIGKALVSIMYIGRRPIDAPAEAAAPRPPSPSPPASKSAIAVRAPPEVPSELRVVVVVERRDVWVEENVDAITLDVALETGALVIPFVYAPEELGTPIARASRVAIELVQGEPL